MVQWAEYPQPYPSCEAAAWHAASVVITRLSPQVFVLIVPRTYVHQEGVKGGGGEGGGGEGGGATDVAVVASVSSTPTRRDGILPGVRVSTREDDLPTRPVARGVQQGLGRESRDRLRVPCESEWGAYEPALSIDAPCKRGHSSAKTARNLRLTKKRTKHGTQSSRPQS